MDALHSYLLSPVRQHKYDVVKFIIQTGKESKSLVGSSSKLSTIPAMHSPAVGRIRPVGKKRISFLEPFKITSG